MSEPRSLASAGAPPKAKKGGAKPLHRPLSPHLQIWRWHVTMLGSILTRITGVGLYVGAIVVAAWLGALAAGPQVYEQFHTYATHPLAYVVWIGLTLSLFYHLAAGVRHFVWDVGLGLTPRTADMLSNLSIWFAVLATVACWGWMFMTGRAVL